MAKDVQEYWKVKAEDHRKTGYGYSSGLARYPVHETRLERLIDILAPFNPGRVLEAGCGTGEVILEFLKRGWDGFGCDFSPNMIYFAKDALENNGFDSDRIIESSIMNMEQYKDKSFDVILCPGVLGYLNDKEETSAFSEFRRILKPSGVLVADNINGLFDLFTFNKFTLQFYENNLLPLFFSDYEISADIKPMLEKLLTNPDKPNIDGHYSTTRDEVYYKIENPLIYSKKVINYGFIVDDMIFFRFHSVPPLLFEQNPELEKVSIDYEKEYCRHWSGNFMASNFIAVMRTC